MYAEGCQLYFMTNCRDCQNRFKINLLPGMNPVTNKTITFVPMFYIYKCTFSVAAMAGLRQTFCLDISGFSLNNLLHAKHDHAKPSSIGQDYRQRNHIANTVKGVKSHNAVMFCHQNYFSVYCPLF